MARFENIRSNTDPLLKRNGKLDIEAKSRVSHTLRDSRQGETSYGALSQNQGFIPCFQERLQATIQPKISS